VYDNWNIDGTHATKLRYPDGYPYITLRLGSRLVYATRDRDGEVIDGDAINATNASYAWIFASNVRSQGSNLKIVATEVRE
jgi:predicted lipid-binding transport protein (Tim44 family)